MCWRGAKRGPRVTAHVVPHAAHSEAGATRHLRRSNRVGHLSQPFGSLCPPKSHALTRGCADEGVQSSYRESSLTIGAARVACQARVIAPPPLAGEEAEGRRRAAQTDGEQGRRLMPPL